MLGFKALNDKLMNVSFIRLFINLIPLDHKSNTYTMRSKIQAIIYILLWL